ncbi:MAG: alpha-D-ribose 1-methylphosphonate 5-triphosphate diphosphatase, partial [Sulfitobacter sp.]
MTNQIVLANAKLILPDAVVAGQIQITDGLISGIETGPQVPKGAVDMGGDFVSAGLVELHTDNLERHLSPRPKVDWPHTAAILAHDRELAGNGITTVFDAMRVGSIISGSSKRYGRYARLVSDELLALRARGDLRISHHIHLRAETCSETLEEELAEFSAEDRVGIVSMMNHTPGQRQFADLEKFETYVRGKYSFGDAEFKQYVTFLYGLNDRFGAEHEAATVAAAHRLGATLASHDDTTVAQVATSHAHGVKLAEFPTTVAAAQACHDHAIANMMGAPNLIRGGSHSGNVAAADLARLDRLDILSSDYVPAGLLMAAVQLGALWDDLPRAMATVTRTPARAVGLVDRGEIALGQRADLVRFSVTDGTVIPRETWCAGE